MENIRVILWGLGAMGSGIGRLLMKKEGVSLVGAICSRESKSGRDVGELLGLDRRIGVKASSDPARVIKETEADLVLHATTSFIKDAYQQFELALGSGLDVITIAEEMAYPSAADQQLAEKLNHLAKENGVTILGTGVNPGFVLDTLIITLSAACEEVESIYARRVNDLSPFGRTVMKTQGVGTTVEEFEAGIKDGTIAGHIGFSQSITMIAEALGLELASIRETREPIISKTRRSTPHVEVDPGMVCGCRHIGYGYDKQGKAVITLEHPQQIHPEIEDIKTGDYITINGTPKLDLAITPETPGGIGTIATAVNMIPQVVAADPGIVTMSDLPLPHAIMGDVRDMVRKYRGDSA